MPRKITLDELITFLRVSENLDQEVCSLYYCAQRGSLTLNLKKIQKTNFTEYSPSLKPNSIKVVSIDEILKHIKQKKELRNM
jgi:hypothetical protein